MLALSATPLCLQMFIWEGIGAKKPTTFTQDVEMYFADTNGHVKSLHFPNLAFADVHKAAHIADNILLELGQDAVYLRGAKIKIAAGVLKHDRHDTRPHVQCTHSALACLFCSLSLASMLSSAQQCWPLLACCLVV